MQRAGEGRRPKEMMTADGSAMDMAGVEADEAMEAAAGGEDAADLSAFLPPTPTDAAALIAPECVASDRPCHWCNGVSPRYLTSYMV